MTPERWQQVKAICYSVLDRDPDERAAVLHAICAGDDELKRDVLRMLDDAGDTGEELERPAWELLGMAVSRSSVLAPPVHSAWVPDAIGRYRIRRVIGEGGMGVVYEAQQDEPRRVVALKVIRPGVASTDVLRRFRQESQALGRLQHSGIAQIYEAGSADTAYGPQPYFAMELVAGEPLTAYASRRGLSIRQRLELMIRICEAVNHAHQRGLIHRDLKPGNILVTEDGQPKILDFGVARLTDSDVQRTQHTDVGELVGTLAYMSPEQVLADPLELDIRSDVYALGVILYELLTGRLPYELGPRIHAAVQTIQQQDAMPLGAISRSFRGDLETIAAKALEKDKERRYGSASALAADLRRHLTDEPIVARPASATYQLQKFARRHRAFVAGVAAVFIVLVAGIVATTREAVRARTAEQAALAAEQAAQAVSDFLQNDLLAQAGAYAQADRAATPDPDLTVRTALDRAAQRIGDQFERDPLLEASIRQTIGATYAQLGVYAEAERHLQQAHAARTRLLGAEHADTLATLGRLADVFASQGRFAQAQTLYSDLERTYRRLRGEDDLETLGTMNDLAVVLYEQDKHAEAEQLMLQVLGGRQRALGEDHPDTAEAMTTLAVVYQTQGKLEQAEPLATRTLDIRRRVQGADHPATLEAMHNLGTLYARARQYEKAEQLLLEALAAKRRVLGDEHRETLVTMNNLATTYRWQGDFGRAEAMLDAVVDVQRKVLGNEHPDTLGSVRNLAEVQWSHGKTADAERLFRSVLAARDRIYGPTSIVSSDTRRSLGKLLLETGDYSAAEVELRRALAGYEKSGADTWARYHVMTLLGSTLVCQRRFADAEPLLTQGYEGLLRHQATIPESSRADVAAAAERIVAMYQAWGSGAQADMWKQRIAGAAAPAQP
jgi:tetratricopeptide (TPR) repeat protein